MILVWTRCHVCSSKVAMCIRYTTCVVQTCRTTNQSQSRYVIRCHSGQDHGHAIVSCRVSTVLRWLSLPAVKHWWKPTESFFLCIWVKKLLSQNQTIWTTSTGPGWSAHQALLRLGSKHIYSCSFGTHVLHTCWTHICICAGYSYALGSMCKGIHCWCTCLNLNMCSELEFGK